MAPLPTTVIYKNYNFWVPLKISVMYYIRLHVLLIWSKKVCHSTHISQGTVQFSLFYWWFRWSSSLLGPFLVLANKSGNHDWNCFRDMNKTCPNEYWFLTHFNEFSNGWQHLLGTKKDQKLPNGEPGPNREPRAMQCGTSTFRCTVALILVSWVPHCQIWPLVSWETTT